MSIYTSNLHFHVFQESVAQVLSMAGAQVGMLLKPLLGPMQRQLAIAAVALM